jgi:tetratricopeptide (TPR) repeat protein
VKNDLRWHAEPSVPPIPLKAVQTVSCVSSAAIIAILLFGATIASADTAAVLPFTNRVDQAQASQSNASQSNLDWIGESIAETVRDALGSRGIVTPDRNDVQEAYRRLGLRDHGPMSQASAMKIGETLDAEHVVYGSFAFAPAAGSTPERGSRGSLKISAQIINLRRLHLGPEFVETGSLEDLATLQAHLSWRALELLAPKLAPPESEFRALKAPIRLDAEESYVRGLLARDPEQKEKLFIQAARLDARFGHPCFQLGQIHYQRKEYRQAAEWLEKVAPEDVHYREASFVLGLARFQSGDYPGAQKAFQMIVAAVPLSEVYNDLGASESRRNLPQAIEDFRKALEGDGNDPVYHFNLGYALWKKGDFVAAADRFRAVLDRDPEDQMATLLLGRCLKKQSLRAGDARGADARLVGLERLKSDYQERAYWQLKSMLEPAPR